MYTRIASSGDVKYIQVQNMSIWYAKRFETKKNFFFFFEDSTCFMMTFIIYNKYS